MKIKIRKSRLKRKRMSGFLARRRTRGGRRWLSRQRARRK
jgi:ribosomal protein L34